MNIFVRNITIIMSFVLGMIIVPHHLSAEMYEGWIDSDSLEPIQPIWMEIKRESSGTYSGWYMNRANHDSVSFIGEMTKSGLILKVMYGRKTVVEQFTLSKSNFGYEGFWKPAKGYNSDVRLFKTEPMYHPTMKLSIDTTILRKGKGWQNSITDIQFLMVRKGIASIKVFRERIHGDRPWVSYHVIDLLKNKEIQLTDYLNSLTFSKTKIVADEYAEQEAINQLKEYVEEDLEAMKECGLDLDHGLHLDDFMLYPNRTAITFDYVNIFGMKVDCDYELFPVRFTMPIEDFKQCIRPGTFLSRLLL